MKSIIKIVAIAALALATPAIVAGATTENNTVTKEYKCDIDCESCVKKIMNTLPFQRGVKDVKADVKSKIITVRYDGSKSSDEAIIEGLAKVGIKAEVKGVAKEAKPNCESGCCK